jgi:hypothetical protein
MFFEKEIGQDIAVLPMPIPRIDDPAPDPIREGTTTVPGPTSVSAREGEANRVADAVEPEEANAVSQLAVEAATRSSSGRASKPPDCLIEEIGVIVAAGATAVANYEIALMAAEVSYYATMKEMGKHPGEIACVGAGLGGGFENTQELHVMKYKQAMAGTDKKSWEAGVIEAHDRM